MSVANTTTGQAHSGAIRATYMRGGASKGLFFYEADLPRRHEARDQLLVRLLGSPDTYERQLDGLGGATPDTSKVVIVSSSKRADCDVDFLIGEVSIKDGRIDYSKGCQDLADAVGPFAIHEGIVAPQNGITQVRAWQLSHDYRIDLFVPVQQGRVLETGQFQDIGLSFHAAEIRLELFEPPASNAAPVLLPTGSAIDTLQISGLGKLRVSVLHTADTFVFFRADALELTAKEVPEVFQRSRAKLVMLERIRLQASQLLADSAILGPARLEDQAKSPHLVWVAKPSSFRTNGRAAMPGAQVKSAAALVGAAEIHGDQVDVLARMLSHGKIQASMAGAGAIAVAAAAALPGSVVSELTRTLPGVATRIGDVSGTLAVGAEISCIAGRWRMDKAVLSRSARRLMSGQVYWPVGG